MTLTVDHSARNTTRSSAGVTGDIDERSVTERPAPAGRTTAGTISQDVAVEAIRPSPTNPRTTFDAEALDALSLSIAEHGVLEPIVVRRRPNAATEYELIAGERRWRAAQMAGLTRVPCRIALGVDDRQALELQALENLQRADLNAIEEATTFRQLSDAGLKQTAIARTVGKSQPYIANRLRLLDLPDDVREMIAAGALTAAHGVALARFSEFPAIASKIATAAVDRKWTARDVEKGLPADYELANAGLIRVLHPGAGVDVQACKECPLQAYRKPNEWSAGVCLRPDHYDELKAAAEQRGRETVAQLAAQQHAGGTPAADGEPSTLPNTRDLDRSAIRVIRSDPPTGCTGACPCRLTALDYNGRPEPICSNPQRFERLEKAQSKANAKVRREEYKALAARVNDRLAEVTTFGRKEMAIIGAEMAARVGMPVLREALKRWLPQLADAASHQLATVTRDQLLAAHPYEVLRFCLALKLGDELAHNQQYGSAAHKCKVATWFLRDGPQAAPPVAAAHQDDEDEDYPCESDILCDRCGCPILVTDAETDAALGRHHLAGGASYCGNCEHDTAEQGDEP